MRLGSVKRVVSFIIALSMIMTLVPSVFAASVEDFTDFPTGWSREAMIAAVENGLLEGRSATEIVPEGDLTRAEMATIINRSFGATVEANITSYLDVSADAWYYHEIAKAVNMQTLEGDSASIMRPDDSITREEVFTVIARALVLESDDYTSLDRFSDGDDVSDWAKKYIASLAAKGYVNGDDTGMLNPHENVTREEFAQVMHNIIKTYYVEEGTYTTTGLASDLIRTSDVNLENIVIDGDLIIGDGVGYGSITLTNVTIKGRLVCRGGEKAIKLVNTTVGDKVVVKDINGIVHFENYRDEAVFDDINMITHATFLTRVPSVPSVGGSSKPVHRHRWSTEWTTNDTHHWHECLTAGCKITEDSEKDGYDVHVFDDENDEYCNTCNYYREITPSVHQHNWATEWTTDGTHHWHDCLAADCPIVNNSEKDGYGEHIFDNDQDEYCNTCNHYREVAPPPHEHNWSTEWTSNDTHHWHECLTAGCTITENSEKDSYGVHIYDDEQDEYCNTCNHYREVAPSVHQHNWSTEWTTNDTHHWHECLTANCPIVNNSQKDGYGVHTYDDDQDENCNICNHHREVAPPPHVHNWSTEWMTNDTYHWHECLAAGCPIVINSQKDGFGVHIYDNDQDEYCNTCNHYREVAPPPHVHIWSTDWTSNDTHHWHECSVAGCTVTENSEKDSYGVHTYDDDQDEYCNICNHYREVAPSVHEHEWSTEWTTNDTHHWHECLSTDCPIVNNSQKDGYGVHTYDDDQDENCNICNHHREVAPPPHVHNWSTEWTTNDTYHWHECLNADCPILVNSQKDGYGVHIYDNDQDENCNICNYHRDAITEEYVVEFYNGMMKDDDPIATQKVEKDNTLNGINVSIDDIYTNNGVVITGNEIIYTWDGKDIYNGKFTHSVAPEYIYFNEKDGANTWEVFTEDTVIDEATVGADKTLEVYYAYKNIAVLLSNIVPIDALNTISINADYNSDSRVADTTKVLMINTRDQLEIGKSAIEDKQKEVFTLIGNKTGGMVTPEGIINSKDVALKISDVIPYSRIEDAIITFVYATLDVGTEEEIKEISGYMDSALLNGYVADVQAARAKAAAGDASDLNNIKAEAIRNLEGYAPYTNLLKAFETKKETFDITSENVAFASALADEVEDFTYDEIKPYLENKGYGPIIKLMGKEEDGSDVFEGVFTESQEEYVTGLRTKVAGIRADNTVKTNYTTSLSVELDVVSILENMYSKVTDEALKLFAGNEVYLYDENEALKRFVNIDWFHVFIKETADGRHQINDFFSMYDAMLDTFMLVDDAICWYGDPANYPASDYEAVKSELASDMTAYIDAVINIVDQITTGQAIGGKYTINELIEKVQDLNNIAGALGDSSIAGYADTISTLVDTMTNILTNLGQGNLPGGYSLETVNKLCDKLKAAISNLDNDQYETVNKQANSLIKKALKKLDVMLDELDKDGTIRGKSIDSIIAKFSFLEDIFDQYGSKIKNIISVMANADLGETDIDIDSEWMVDIFFGADDDNRFTADNLIEIAPDKLKTTVNDYTDTADETYIVDYYQVKSGDASLKAQRTIR